MECSCWHNKCIDYLGWDKYIFVRISFEFFFLNLRVLNAVGGSVNHKPKINRGLEIYPGVCLKKSQGRCINHVVTVSCLSMFLSIDMCGHFIILQFPRVVRLTNILLIGSTENGI